MLKTAQLDSIDFQILDCLLKDSRMQLKQIGEIVHFSGPAVAARIAKLESLGIIKRFTIDIAEEQLGPKLHSFVVLYMNSNNHKELQHFIQAQSIVTEAHKISGKGCYLFKVSSKDQVELDTFLDALSFFGAYQLNISINKIK